MTTKPAPADQNQSEQPPSLELEALSVYGEVEVGTHPALRPARVPS